MDHECFLAERTNRYCRELRRYAHSQDQNELCPGRIGYHNAVRSFDMITSPPEDDDLEGNSTVEFCGKDDPHWPAVCEGCAYIFRNGDMWQWNQHRIYRKPSSGEEFTLSKAPIGAMYFSDWMGWKGPDGHCLTVVTPGGEWMIDGPSRGDDGVRGPCWTRMGEPPKVTARPSILMPNYHGFLTNGVLTAV